MVSDGYGVGHKRPKIEGISHIDPSWAKRVPRPRLRHLVGKPEKFGGMWVLWLYAQVMLFVVELVLILAWGVLIVVLTLGDAVFG